ncbi:MAG: BlaI/MecI/CopY family transcriptional regulator [Blautia sp.]|nr:BlaI/MecI/CopY family transcriptional regulator [Blautia sp.]
MESKITESEWQLMELVWQGVSTQPEMMGQLGKKWNKNTVHTFLTRLCAKGYLAVDRESSPHVYRALVQREDCERRERQNFLQRVYQGSVGNMVASFVKDGQLSEREVDELRRILDSAGQRGK